VRGRLAALFFLYHDLIYFERLRLSLILKKSAILLAVSVLYAWWRGENTNAHFLAVELLFC